MKIVNMKKFVRSLILMFVFLVLISFIFVNKSFSHSKKSYKQIYISCGDTLWSIAKKEKNDNAYFENKEIREIVYELKTTNKLESSDFKIGQELNIPIL